MSFSLLSKTGHQLPEKLQSKIRLVIGLCILWSFLWLNHGFANISFSDPALLAIISHILFTTILILTIGNNPTTSSKRRSVTIFADIFAVTLLLIFGGESVAPIGMGLLFGMVVMTLLILKHIHIKETEAVDDVLAPNIPTDAKQPPQNTEQHDGLKVLLITQDALDRHMVLSYINSWKIPIKICNSTIRAFAELINAVENGAGYTTVIIDSLNLDMGSIQFSKSLRFDNKLNDIDLIHISPEQPKEQKTQLLAAGYSKLISIPLDKTILFDALHTSTTELQGDSNITKLISRYSSKTGSAQPSDILLAIGNPIEQTLFRSILEKDGQRVYTVSTGSQALEALNTHQFDMVIIDLKLPDINGKDVIKLYYYTNLTRNWVPFIALVDEATPSVLSQCREAEVDAILARPVSEQQLRMTVTDIAASKAKQIENIDSSWKPAHNRNSLTADNSDLILNTHTLRQLENLSSESAFLELMISNFHEDMSRSLNGLQRAIDNHRFIEFQDFAHALRDTSSNLGAVSLQRLSLMALQINQNEFQQQGTPLLNELHLALSKTMHALREYVVNCSNEAKEKE